MKLNNEEINLILDALNALVDAGDDREVEIEVLAERLRSEDQDYEEEA